MIFGVNGDHIAKLGDTEFRVLISYLCEAELRRHGYSGVEVIAGGNQDAADGGIAKMIVTEAPEQDKVLEIVLRRLFPSGWTGSRAPILEKRRKLVAELSESIGGAVKAWAANADALLVKAAADDREREMRHDQSFE